MKQLKWMLIACACGGVLAAGCGQKGPLVLPDKSAKIITRPARSTTSQPTPPAQTPAGPASPAPGPQDSAPQPSPGPTAAGPTGTTTRSPSDKNTDSQSTNPTPPRH